MMKAVVILQTDEDNDSLVRLRLDRLLSALERTRLIEMYGFRVVKRDVEPWTDV